MLRRLKEETGIALPIAIMLVVVIGIMGAGLLVFVTTDLGSVIESNQGQKALNLADAGVQAARSHLLRSNADFRSYDGVTDTAADPPNPESGWSCGSWNTGTKTCGAAGKDLSNLGDSGNSLKVWIQYLQPSTTISQANDSTGVYAPEIVPTGQTNYPVGKDYFKVISQSQVGNTKRKVEAIYNTYSLDVPKAYYTPGNITLNGNAGSITNISLFAGGNIGGKGGQAVAGEDYAYGDWCGSHNTAQRGTKAAGVAALGTVAFKTAGRDFDSSSSPIFVASTPGAPTTCDPASGRSQITFPFNPSLPDMNALRTTAQTQSGPSPNGNNYWEVSASTNVVSSGTGIVWPANSLSSTVVYVKSSSVANTITWNIPGNNCSNPSPPVRGTLVIDNGKFATSPNSTPLRGSIVINSAGPGTEVYTDGGNSCMQSFAIATGDIKINGNVSPATQERGNAAGTYGINLVSWRELYK